jgi:hypothetical protein
VAEKVYRRAPAVEEATVGERAVLYHSGSGNAIVLNPTASLLWKRLATPTNADALSTFLHERFPGIERERLESDALAALDAFEKHDLVTSS